MKIVLFTVLLSLFFSLNVFSQDKYEFVEVVEVEGVSADILYERSKTWLAKTYRSASDVIQHDNPETRQIIGQASIRYEPNYLSGRDMTRGYIRYEINITSRDGRFRYQFTDFVHEGSARGGSGNAGLILIDEENPNPIRGGGRRWNTTVWNDIKDQINDSIKPLINDLIEYMGSDSEIDDDW